MDRAHRGPASIRGAVGCRRQVRRVVTGRALGLGPRGAPRARLSRTGGAFLACLHNHRAVQVDPDAIRLYLLGLPCRPLGLWIHPEAEVPHPVGDLSARQPERLADLAGRESLVGQLRQLFNQSCVTSARLAVYRPEAGGVLGWELCASESRRRSEGTTS
jgi:hypothetical protein